MSSRNSPPLKDALGTLHYRQDCLNSLKCLVAIRMTKQHVDAVPILGKKKDQTSFVLADGSGTLYDPFAISWFLSSYDYKVNKNPDRYGAQVMQWNSFANSEIKPYLTGLGKEGHIQRRDMIKANNMRKIHLIAALNMLNSKLTESRFLIGNKVTLADVSLAVDLIPLFNSSWMAEHGNKFMQEILRKNYAYIREWFFLVTDKGMFANAYKQFMAGVPRKSSPNGKKRLSPEKSEVKKEDVDMSALVAKPLRMLCIHGYRQNETTFREKLGAFRKQVGKYIDFTFITAPHRVLPMSAEDINQDQRGWWFSRENDYFKADDASDCDKGFEESLELIQKTFDLHGPFDGIFGFSQGACLVSLLCLMKQHRPESLSPVIQFNFAVMCAPFKSLSTKHACWYESDVPKVSTPTMFILGNDDRVIRRSVSEQIVHFFAQPTKVYHSGGHYVPATARQKSPYFRFFHKVHAMCNGLTNEHDKSAGDADSQEPVVNEVIEKDTNQNESKGVKTDDGVKHQQQEAAVA